MGLLPIALVVGLAIAGQPASAADKPPATKPVWSSEAKYDLERVSIGAGGTVVYARDGKKMTGLSAADGKQKYQRNLDGFEEKGWWGRVEDTTYVYSTSKELIGIDIATGTDRWHVSPGDGIKTDAWRAPRIGHPKAMLFAFENGTSVWDIAPGKVLWSAKEPLSEDLVPSCWANENDPETGVLVFLPKRTVYVGRDGKELWSAADAGNRRRGGKDVNRSAVENFGRVLLVYLSKQVVLLNNATGEVLASQAFPSDEAAADVEAFRVGGAEGAGPVLVTLGGRVFVVDTKEGKVLAKTPENSILGQAAGGLAQGDDFIAMTMVRGGEKAPDAGAHLYRINAASGAVTWHAYNGAIVDTRQILANVVGERVNGPYYLDKAKGVLLATSDKGVRLYNWEDGKERWALDQELPYSYRVMTVFGGNSFAVIRSMMQNRMYVATNPTPVEGDGVVYVASDDEVFAIDSTTGKPRWTSKSKNLSMISGMENGGANVILRQGLYADANDYGAPTTIVTQTWGRTWVEEPEIYIEEDPYGYVGLDAATGKESWSCLDFEPHEPAMEGPMPKDASICNVVAKAKKEKGCKLSKLGVGGILSSYQVGGNAVYFGKDGIAGAAPGSCAAAWSVDGSVKKQQRIYEMTPYGEDHSVGFVQKTGPDYLVTHYGNNVNVVDVASGKIILAAGKADTVKVDWASKLLFAADGNNLAMYRLP